MRTPRLQPEKRKGAATQPKLHCEQHCRNGPKNTDRHPCNCVGNYLPETNCESTCETEMLMRAMTR